MNVPKKRGRPPKAETVENRRIRELLSSPPTHIPSLTKSELKELQESFAHNEKIRQEILATHKYGQWTPDEHAYSMASLGDESFAEFEKKILDDDDKYRIQAQRIRQKAGYRNRRHAEQRAALILDKNRALVSKIGTGSTYKKHKIAKILHAQWSTVTPAQRLKDEPTTLISRGDGKKPPSIRTLERWLS